jgi:hypothetical protein
MPAKTWTTTLSQVRDWRPCGRGDFSFWEAEPSSTHLLYETVHRGMRRAPTCWSNHSLDKHGVRDFDEPGNIRAIHIAHFSVCLLTVLQARSMNSLHDHKFVRSPIKKRRPAAGSKYLRLLSLTITDPA